MLPPCYNSIVTCLFQANLTTLTVDIMLGKLTAYEGYMLGSSIDSQLPKNLALQVDQESHTGKKKKKKVEEDEDEESDNEDLALLIKKLFRKGRPSSFNRNFGCFNCSKKCHFAKSVPSQRKRARRKPLVRVMMKNTSQRENSRRSSLSRRRARAKRRISPRTKLILLVSGSLMMIRTLHLQAKKSSRVLP